MIIETELKLTIDKEYIDKLLHHPLLRQYQHKPPEQYRLYSTYFDTQDHVLLHKGYALRVRKVGDRFIQTIKTTNASHEGLHQRREWQQDVAGMPDLSAFQLFDSDKTWVKNLAKLDAIFTTDMMRTSLELLIDQTIIELSLDIGKVIAGDLFIDIVEVELELLEGDQQKLFYFSQLLGRDIPLTVENKSKAEYGYRLHSETISSNRQ
jgi:triphosphatase